MNRAQSARGDSGAPLIWDVEGKPVSVSLKAEAIKCLKSHIPASGLDRQNEIGGLLLGRVAEAEGHYFITIEAVEVVACEHVRGASWTLSRADKRALLSRLSSLSRTGGVVGWFRTHTRPGLYLDQHDFELFRDVFGDPGSVALLVRPEPRGPAIAGFFFWENGEIQRVHSYRTFELEPVTAQWSVSAPVTQEMGIVPISPSSRKLREPVHVVSAIRSTAAKAAPDLRKGLVWVPVAAGLAAGVLWNPMPLEENTAGIRITEERQIAAGDRPVFAMPEEPDVSDAALAAPELEPSGPSTEQTRSRIRTLQQPVRQFVATQPRRVVPEPMLNIPEAPQISGEAGNFESLPAARTTDVRAVASVEPVKSSVLRRAFGSIPGLGFLKKKRSKDDEHYLPPKPIRQVEPEAGGLYAAETPVRVKVTVGRSGDVIDTQLLSRRVEPEVAQRAVDAAKRWRFEPATIDDKPVDVELVLSFRFPGNGSGT